MSTTTIDDILAEVDKLDAEATPAPWQTDGHACVRTDRGDHDREQDVCEVLDYGSTGGPFDSGTARFIARARTLLPLLAAEVRKLQSAKADEIEAVLARHREAFGANAPQAPRSDIVREMIDRLTRDAAGFRQTAHVSVSDARIRADACRVHSEALAKVLTMARDLAEEGHHDRAVALLRGDMPAPKETP